MENELLFSLLKWGEFGQKRYTATLTAGEKQTIPLVVPAGRWWLVFKYRIGDIAADVFNFRFNHIRNYFEEDILLGMEHINHTISPQPYLSISGEDGTIVIENTDIISRDFSIVLDFVVMDDEIAGRIREMILGEREAFRKLITELQYKTPSLTWPGGMERR